MDPKSVFRTLWAHKLLTIPFILIIVAGCVGALFFGPRSYESTATYVLLRPSDPPPRGTAELANDPYRANPYLGAGDLSLMAQVTIARLAAVDIGDQMAAEGYSTEYLTRTGLFGSAQIITISASAGDPELSTATTLRVGEKLNEQLRNIQIASGATGSSLVTAQSISEPYRAVEKASGRLRSVIMVGIAGVVLLFGMISFVRALDSRTTKRTPAGGNSEWSDAGFSFRPSESPVRRRRRGGSVPTDEGLSFRPSEGASPDMAGAEGSSTRTPDMV